MLILARTEYIWRVRERAWPLLSYPASVSAGIPVLSGTWANVLCEILIAIVGGKGKKKKKASAFFHMFCKETVQMDYLLVWSFLLPQPAQVQVVLDLPKRERERHTHQCAHTPPVWSTTGYYWLTCLNSASSESHSNSFSILLSVWIMDDVPVFLPNIPHVPRSHRDMFVAFLFVAWETMLACLLTFHTWFHPLNP